MDYWFEDDLLEAEKILLLEAKAGNGHAAHNLATLYVTGGPDLVDPAKARYWYEQDLAAGYEETIASDPTWFRKNDILE